MNNIIASKTVKDQQTDFSKTAHNICEEDLVYLRIWSIENKYPSTIEPQLKSHSRIAQCLSQDNYVPCIVSKVWTWERIQEEISSTLMQHLGCIPPTQPRNSSQKITCFYHCSKDEPQRQAIPFPTLPKLDVQMTSKDNSSTMDPIESYVKIEGNCFSSASFILYPIFHRMDFWNAIHPFESLSTNIKWAVDMVVFYQPSKPLRRIYQCDKPNNDIHDSNFKSINAPNKIEEPFRKRNHLDGPVSEKSKRIITILNEQVTGEEKIACESECSVETELRGQHKDTSMKGSCNHVEELIEPSKLSIKEMYDIVSGYHRSGPASCPSELHFEGPHVNKEGDGIQHKGEIIEVYLKRQGISQNDNQSLILDTMADFLTMNRDENNNQSLILDSLVDFLTLNRNESCHRQEQQQQSTLISKRRCSLEQFLPKNVLPSVEDPPLTPIDSLSSCGNDMNGLDIGPLPGSIIPRYKVLIIGINDKQKSTIFKHEHEEKGAKQSEMSSMRNLEHKKSMGKQAKTTNHCQQQHKKKERHVATTSTNRNPKWREKLKARTERNKKTIPEYSGIHPYDVICYPKQAGLKNIGNRRLDILVEMAASHYDAAMDKAARSKVVESVVNTIHEAGGDFVRWCQIRGNVAASQFLACLTVREKFDEALVFRGRLLFKEFQTNDFCYFKGYPNLSLLSCYLLLGSLYHSKVIRRF